MFFQCPSSQTLKDQMFTEIIQASQVISHVINDNPEIVLEMLLRAKFTLWILTLMTCSIPGEVCVIIL